MRGAIHGIWLTGPNGKLHPEVIPSMSSWAADASAADFSVILWTNLEQLDPAEVQRALAAKITVKDHKECKDSSLYKYFTIFLDKGVSGDKTAFALASDVFRMAVLEQIPNDQFFIYADPNDTGFIDLNTHLQNMDLAMRQNNLGYAFMISPLESRPDVFVTRNDVLVARKDRNLNFFQDYLRAYRLHLEQTVDSYRTPTTDVQAHELANTISSQISGRYFDVKPASDLSINVIAQFGEYREMVRVVNLDNYLAVFRKLEHANTWMPVGTLRDEAGRVLDENAEIAAYDKFMQQKLDAKIAEIQTTQQPWFTESTIEYLKAASAGAVFGAILMATALWLVTKSKLIRFYNK